jgi:hypothetical protein
MVGWGHGLAGKASRLPDDYDCVICTAPDGV